MEPLLSKTNKTSFGIGLKPFGAKKWTKYPFTTWKKEGHNILIVLTGLVSLSDLFATAKRGIATEVMYSVL